MGLGTQFIPVWLVWSLIALVSWGVWAVLGKLIGEALSGGQSQALSTIGIVPLMLALGLSRKPVSRGRKQRGTWIALAAGALGSLGNVAYYDALGRGGKAAAVIPLTALYPLVTLVLAVVLLKERLNKVQVAGIGMSLAAVYLFNVTEEGERDGLISPELSFAVLPILFWGVAGFLQKLSTNDLSGELATLWFLAAYVPVAVVLIVLEPIDEPPTMKTWLFVTLLGFFLALGNYALLAAFARQGKASVITPLSGLYPAVSVPIAILFLGETVGYRETTGIVLALISVVALACEARPGEEVPSAQPSTLKQAP